MSKLLTTGDHWRALVERIDFDGIVGAFCVDVIEADAPLGVMLSISRVVRDVRDNKKWRRNIVAYKVKDTVTEEREACRYILDLVSGNLAHEAAEFFTLDGARIFDPHAPAPAPKGKYLPWRCFNGECYHTLGCP